jgi:hypothetical protein
MRTALIAAILFSMPIALSAGDAKAATFGGYECTGGCAGHAAGYDWAQEHDIDEAEMCPEGNSQSFHEGCLVYTEDPSRGSDEDDDGQAIDK